MSDMLTHWAAFEDCRRLAAVDERVDPWLVSIMEERRDIARLGALSRAGSIFVPHILEQQRRLLREDGLESVDQARMAYALGGITHYPVDVMMKPLARSKSGADWHKEHVRMKREGGKGFSPAREVSAYYDTHVFRKVYAEGREEPFCRFFLAENDTETGQELESFVFSLFERWLLDSYTLEPDK